MVVALLGMLKAGGAYVPLDPPTRRERLALMLEDGARAGAGDSARACAIGCRRSAPAPVRVLLERALARPSDEPAAGAAEPRRRTTWPTCIFTSGSTGPPKGVAVEHRQLANYVVGVMRRMELRPDEGASFATVSSFAADLGNTICARRCCGGGRLHVVAEERLGDPAALGR